MLSLILLQWLFSSGDSPLQPPKWLRGKGGDKCLNRITPVHSVPVCHLQGECVALGRLAHQALLFAFLELPEILLNQESGVELPNSHLVIWKGALPKRKVKKKGETGSSKQKHQAPQRFSATYDTSTQVNEGRDCSTVRALCKQPGSEVNVVFG